MTLVPLASLREGPNIRRVPPNPDAQKGLENSIAASGILQAMIARHVRVDEDTLSETDLEIVLGFRRLRAAQKLKLAEVPIDVREMTDAEVRMAQLIENIQREDMHPVDQWKAVREIMLDGVDLDVAAKQLGMDARTIRRMDQLGRLNRLFLELCQIRMPQEHQIRIIANAPAKKQQEVAKGRDLVVQRGDVETVQWDLIAQRCRTDRISRSVALFDWEKAKFAWDEDLYAQPGDPDQFTTMEVDRFLKLQQAAMITRVKALAEARGMKDRVQLATVNNRGDVVIPHGYTRVFGGNPEKLKRHEVAFHGLLPNGEIGVVIGLDAKAAKAATKKKLAGNGSTSASHPDPDADPEDNDQDPASTESPPEDATVTKEGLRLIAVAKTTAIQAQLTRRPMDAKEVIRLLLIAFACDNVTVRGEHYTVHRFNDVVAKLLEPGGNPLDLAEAEITALGALVIRRVVAFHGPNAASGTNSGAAGEIIGHLVDAGQAFGRFDTAEFLKTVNAETLRAAALTAEIKPPKSVAALRDQLVGKLPAWRPPGAVFGAPAPRA